MASDQKPNVSDWLVNEGAARLTKMERALIVRLYRAAGQVVDRTTLLADVFGYHPSAETHTLATHVWRLRQKIEVDPSNPQKVISRDGGYVLMVGPGDAEPGSGDVNGQRRRGAGTAAEKESD